jgi:1L-myo-inositol 1-phosphate cytidylyltransferase
MASKATDAVILMAGSGSRIRASGENLPKSLLPICGQPLISYLLEALEKAGVTNLHIVVGPHGRDLAAKIRPLLPSSMRLNEILNRESQRQNGLSVLCAAGHVIEPFILMMGDHLFEFALLERLLEGAEHDFLNLAIDRKVEKIFDLDDAMKIQTAAGLVSAIGKTLPDYDAIDTGVFVCPNDLFDYLRLAVTEGDCSLADGVRLMAADGRVRAVDIGPAWWQDVDTQAMRQRAEEDAPRIFLRSRAPAIR